MSKMGHDWMRASDTENIFHGDAKEADCDENVQSEIKLGKGHNEVGYEVDRGA